MKSRTRARSVALQVLYEVDITTHTPGIVFQQRLSEVELTPELEEFVRRIVFGVLPLAKSLDSAIAKYD